MIDKVAEWGFPVGKFELKLMVKDMLTKKGNYNQKKFRKAKVHKGNNKNIKRCENYLTLTIKDQNDLIELALVSLILILNIFYTLLVLLTLFLIDVAGLSLNLLIYSSFVHLLFIYSNNF